MDKSRNTKYSRVGSISNLGQNIFWVSKKARWSVLRAAAKLPTIGKVIDDAMLAIEQENPSLKGVLLKDYSRPSLDKERLGQLIDLIGTRPFF